MNEHMTYGIQVDWSLPKPMLYTVSWKFVDGDTIHKEHLTLMGVEDTLHAIHFNDEGRTNPKITDVKIVSEY